MLKRHKVTNSQIAMGLHVKKTDVSAGEAITDDQVPFDKRTKTAEDLTEQPDENVNYCRQREKTKWPLLVSATTVTKVELDSHLSAHS